MASGARTANRVVAISKGEAENSEDVDFKNNLDAASGAVSTGKIKIFIVFSLSLSFSLFLSLSIHSFILPQSTLTVAIAPMVTTAKGAITQSGNAAAQEQFSAKADNVRIDC